MFAGAVMYIGILVLRHITTKHFDQSQKKIIGTQAIEVVWTHMNPELRAAYLILILIEFVSTGSAEE